MSKNIAVLGLDTFNRKYLLNDLIDTQDVVFHAALDRREIALDGMAYPFEERLNLARTRMEKIPNGIQGLITYWDFPPSSMAPFLAREFGLTYPSVESVVKCEHKLWSREEQKKVVKTPAFCSFHPDQDDAFSQITLDFPFWIKPVVAHSSMLGFEISCRADFDRSLNIIRDRIDELTQPFQYVIEHTRLPDHLADQGARLCIAEEIISHGDQYTLEGYVQGGEVVVYGIVDSVRLENAHTFSRYQYPSQLQPSVVLQMEDLTQKVLHQFEYDNAPFNIEFFYNSKDDSLAVLEINSRMSQSHSDLFLKVDGQPHQQIAVDLALNRTPRWRYRKGKYDIAAKFFLRRFEDGIIRTVPDESTLRDLAGKVPDSRVDRKVSTGRRLSEFGHLTLEFGRGSDRTALHEPRDRPDRSVPRPCPD